MTIEPLLQASLAIKLHLVGVVPALLIGPIILWRRKGTRLHKLLGRVWVAAMIVTTLSSFFIFQVRLIGPFSPIHLLSVLSCVGLFQGIQHVRAGRIAAHSATMRSLYFGAMMVAGSFTLLPNRLLNIMLFGDDPDLARQLIAVGLVALLLCVTGIVARARYLSAITDAITARRFKP